MGSNPTPDKLILLEGALKAKKASTVFRSISMSGWPSGLRRQTQRQSSPQCGRAFWSSEEGVGSNPTPDKLLLLEGAHEATQFCNINNINNKKKFLLGILKLILGFTFEFCKTRDGISSSLFLGRNGASVTG